MLRLRGVPLSFYLPGMAARCRLCSANDRDALIEQLAERMWELHRDAEIDPPWADASPYWQRAMRGFARVTADVCVVEHVVA